MTDDEKTEYRAKTVCYLSSEKFGQDIRNPNKVGDHCNYTRRS